MDFLVRFYGLTRHSSILIIHVYNVLRILMIRNNNEIESIEMWTVGSWEGEGGGRKKGRRWKKRKARRKGERDEAGRRRKENEEGRRSRERGEGEGNRRGKRNGDGKGERR